MYIKLFKFFFHKLCTTYITTITKQYKTKLLTKID